MNCHLYLLTFCAALFFSITTPGKNDLDIFACKTTGSFCQMVVSNHFVQKGISGYYGIQTFFHDYETYNNNPEQDKQHKQLVHYDICKSLTQKIYGQACQLSTAHSHINEETSKILKEYMLCSLTSSQLDSYTKILTNIKNIFVHT